MNSLRTELDQLENQRLDYVMARSRVNSDAQAIRESGVPKATFYCWDKAERDNLNELAQKIKRNVALRMIAKLENAGEEAVDTLLKTLKSRNDSVKQRAAVEVMDRLLGKPTQKQEISGKDNEPFVINVKLVEEDD
jgi:HEAT repeat protein